MGLGHHHHHDHHDHSGHSHNHGAGSRALRSALIVTAVFMVAEFIGGWYANSLALMSDAVHMLTDVGALLVGMVALWIARRPSNPKMTYGYQRAEILGALVSGVAIWFLAAGLVYEAIERFRSPQEVRGMIVIVVGSGGLLVNLVSMFFLHKAQDESMNVRAAYLHVLGDALGSVAAIASGVVITYTGWTLIDPIVTCLVAALILYSSWHLVREAIDVLMESTPKGIDAEQVQADLQQIGEVDEVHDLHIWSVATGMIALSAHLISRDSESTLVKAREILRTKYSILHTTLQVEHPDRFDRDNCYDCIH